MRKVWLVTTTGIKNVLRMRIVLVILIPITLICVVGIALLLCLLLIGPEAQSASPDKDLLEGYIGLILYSSTLISIGVTLNSLVFQTMVREKSRGNLAALLATPLKASEIWLGKSLALFIPGLVLGVVLACLSWLIVNLVYFWPDIGFVISWEGAVSSLVAVPLMYFCFGLLVHLIGLTARTATGNVVAQIFLPVIANVMIQLVARNVMDAGSWPFMLLNFGLALVMGVLVLAVRSRLTAEQIMISG